MPLPIEEDRPSLIFVYGTLGPADAVEAVAGDWRADQVRGELYDVGPYPILVRWDDPAAGWVDGHCRAVHPDVIERVLDPYEGVDEGLFRRVAVTTRAGRRAWLYAWPADVPAGARGPLSRWDGRRVRLIADGTADDSPEGPGP